MEVGREDAADVRGGGGRAARRVPWAGEGQQRRELLRRTQDSTTSGCGREGRGMCDDLECLAGRLGLQERKGGGKRF